MWNGGIVCVACWQSWLDNDVLGLCNLHTQSHVWLNNNWYGHHCYVLQIKSTGIMDQFSNPATISYYTY